MILIYTFTSHKFFIICIVWEECSILLIIGQINNGIRALLFSLLLTHWGLNKLAAIFQTTFSNAFSWMKMYEFRLRFHWGMFPRASMGLLPDTQNCGCACAGNAGNVFPVTAGERSRHASRHVRHARAVMHAWIANQRFHLKSAAGGNVPGITGACATCNFTYLVRGPLVQIMA